MSRHIFFSEHHGEPIKIFMGWEASMRGFFMYIEKDNEVIWSSFDKYTDCPSTLTYFIRDLDDLDLTVPIPMLHEVAKDRFDYFGHTEGRCIGHCLHSGNYLRREI